MFLKRSSFGHITAEDLYLGATLNVFSRQVKIAEYADVFTRNELEGNKSRTLALVKPDAYPHLGKIIAEVYKMGFVISKMKMVKLSKAEAAEFYSGIKGTPFFEETVDFICSDVVTAMEVVGNHAIQSWREKIGATETSKDDPSSLRSIYGSSSIKNALHGSDSITAARTELEFFFEKKYPTTAIFNNCACAVIRPHAIKQSGDIIDRVLQEGFEISALEMRCLSTVSAEEFLEVYKGVLPEYHDIVKQMCSGPVIAMEVRQEEPWRQLEQLKFELDAYKPGLSSRPSAVIANKMDLEESMGRLVQLKEVLGTDAKIIPISGKMGNNLAHLLTQIKHLHEDYVSGHK